MMRWFPLLQVFQEKTVYYKKMELELANMILRVAGLPEVEKIHINYNEQDILPISIFNDTLYRDIMLNVETPIDEILRRNPEITEEEAQAEFMTNKELNDKYINKDVLDLEDKTEKQYKLQ